MAGSDIVSAHVGPPPADAPPATGSPVIPALYVTVRIPSNKPGAALESLWEADLLEGAVVEAAGSSPALDGDIGYIYFSGQLPDGTVTPDMGGGIGDIARGQQFSGANDSDATIQKAIDQTVAAYGLTLGSVHIFHALGAAPAVVLTAANTSFTTSYQSLVDDLFGSPPRYEGYYLEIRGPDGTPLARESASFLTGAGRNWLDPSVDGSGSLPQHLGPSPSP